MLVRSLRTRWRWLLQITMLFLHVTLPLPTLSIKALTLRLLGRWGVGLWKDVHHPHPTVTSTLNKANYPFYQPGLSIGFWAARGSKAFDCVDHNKLWKILKEMGLPDHLTCLLRNIKHHFEVPKWTKLYSPMVWMLWMFILNKGILNSFWHLLVKVGI